MYSPTIKVQETVVWDACQVSARESVSLLNLGIKNMYELTDGNWLFSVRNGETIFCSTGDWFLQCGDKYLVCTDTEFKKRFTVCSIQTEYVGEFVPAKVKVGQMWRSKDGLTWIVREIDKEIIRIQVFHSPNLGPTHKTHGLNRFLEIFTLEKDVP